MTVILVTTVIIVFIAYSAARELRGPPRPPRAHASVQPQAGSPARGLRAAPCAASAGPRLMMMMMMMMTMLMMMIVVVYGRIMLE